ncbi:hypothetical protein RCH21_001711 [Arthrobacter sp. PL16]|uniref:hypothetical protein n=1 Tax=Arthrobacter cheniae TaxID=1258888 RepID=UPI0015FEBCC8|nr:hypothetical protein [Arthrobacter cheniae]MEC5199480.1 hypothetical protein [Arthrobacter sp. PL16]
MYGSIFRALPGPLWMRIVLSVVLVLAAVAVLLVFVFPWISQFSPLTDSTIGSP